MAFSIMVHERNDQTTLGELGNEMYVKEVHVHELGTGEQLDFDELPSDTIAVKWDYSGDDDEYIDAYVQQEKEIPYIHIGAGAPNYAVNSISSLSGALSYIASTLGIYADEEWSHLGTCDLILVPDTTDEQIEELFQKTKEYMENDGYTDVDASRYGISYDAATATSEMTEPTRNW